METTHPFPTPTGGHGFVSIQGKVYHRITLWEGNAAEYADKAVIA